MTVQNIKPFSTHIANGSTDDFLFTYYVYNQIDVKVIMDGTVVRPTIVLNPDQQLNPGGYMHFDIVPKNGAQIASWRETPLIQATDYPGYGTFPSEAHEGSMDVIVLMVQDLFHKTNGAIRVQPQESDTFLGLLPTVLNRQNTLLGFDVNGQVVVVDPKDLPITFDSDAVQHDATTVGAELREHDGRIDSNAAQGNHNAGSITQLDARTSDAELRLSKIEPLLVITTAAAVILTDRVDALEIGKADASNVVRTDNPLTITVTAPDMGSDITINTRNNLPGGLLRLDGNSKVKLSQMPIQAMTLQGIWYDEPGQVWNPDDRYPNIVWDSGDMFVLDGDTTISVLDPETELPIEKAATESDLMIYVSDLSKVAVTGWYWIPHVSTATLARDVVFDPTSTVYAGINMQAVMEEQSVGHLWRDRAETVNTSLLVGTTLTVNSVQTNNAGIKFGNESASTAGITDSNDENMLRSTANTSEVGSPTTEVVISSASIPKSDVADGGNQPFLVEVYNAPTPASVGADPAGTASSLVAAHKIEASAHIPSVVGADPVGTAASAVSTHNAATDAHSVDGIDGLTEAMAAKYDKIGGTVSGSIRIEGVAVATGDVTGFEGT